MIAIIDYDMGNLYSLNSMLHHLNAETCVTRDAAEIEQAAGVILPGVGSFRAAMDKLRHYGLIPLLQQQVAAGQPLLGICLGMQLLGQSSTEDGDAAGLGFIQGKVTRFTLDADNPRKKIPHVGFNDILAQPGSRLLAGLPAAADFYFTHSYCMQCEDTAVVSSTADNDQVFVASVERGNVFGTQFHPELSQSHGLQLMGNYLRLCGL